MVLTINLIINRECFCTIAYLLLGAVLLINFEKMKKEYVVRDLETGLFYGALTFGWIDDIKLSYRSDTIEDAERVISQRPKGYYIIDVVYVV